LVNESSASASEIVAGALKNHERAVIIGQRTFGKGSVQLLFDNPDESALKLTIAQYLTPGDISIQSVGVTPSIELSPILISEEDTYMYGVPDRKYGEATLDEHLTNDKSEAAKLQKPLMSMRYLQDHELIKKMRDEPNKIFVDFEIEFARDLLKASASPRLKRLVQRAEKLISQQQRLQERALDERLKERGVRWSSEGEVSEKGAQGEASVSLSPGGVVTAGQDLTVTLTVRNTSTQPLHKLRAITSSENNLLKGHEFLFGYVPPGEERTWTQKIKVDPSSKRRRDEVTVTFTAEGKGEVAPLSFPVEVQALPHPLFALRYELSDREGGDGDGLLEPGEEVSVALSFENKGAGESVELVGQLSNEGNGVAPGLFIKQGRVQPDKQQLKAGERGELTFVFKVKEGWREPLTKAYLMLIDPKLRESSSELLSLAIHPQGSDVTPRSATIKARKGALKLYPQPHNESLPVSQSNAPLKVEGCLEAKAEGCAWYRLKGASGWLWARGDEVSEVSAEVGSPAPYFSVAPPSITLSELPHHTTDKRIKLSGVARCDEGLEDVMIYVNNRKVFFLAKTEMKRRDEAPFEAELPLEEGVNYITVYARHSEHRVGQEIVVISRPKQDQEDKTE
jgi:carboxyl-terminal processing protease